MERFLRALKEKITKDQVNLKRILLLDKLFSISILLLNLSLLGVAITTLVILVRKGLETQSTFSEPSFIILLILVIFIISSFILTVVLAIYRANSKYHRYKKIKNTLIDLGIKYQSGVISEEELTQYLNVLYDKLNKKHKVAFSNVVKEQLSGGKNV
ncbi:DUF4231 domain-containing protein [Mycoplasmopsis sturni]|uniref:DUF4231 domain-containing protein n=1 Tax=Mycoplasmopsis sturni TaxID=39047 RepID=UPI00056075ED|nr:DUF4231 domain-containing protein [Mycoplasmopsis sturni]